MSVLGSELSSHELSDVVPYIVIIGPKSPSSLCKIQSLLCFISLQGH